MNINYTFLFFVALVGAGTAMANDLIDAIAIGDFALAKKALKKSGGSKRATEFVDYISTKPGVENVVWKLSKVQRDELLKFMLPRVAADKREVAQKAVAAEEERKNALKKNAERVEIEREKQKAEAAIDAELEPLIEAIGKNDIEGVKQLLATGIRLNVTGAKWPPPLLWAMHFGRLEIVELLLDGGADPNFIGHASSIIANAACLNRDLSPEILQLLLDKGMRRDLFLEPRVLECATRNGHSNILKFIRELDSSVS